MSILDVFEREKKYGKAAIFTLDGKSLNGGLGVLRLGTKLQLDKSLIYITWSLPIPWQSTVDLFCLVLDDTVSEVIIWRRVTWSFSSVQIFPLKYLQGEQITLCAVFICWVHPDCCCWHCKFVNGDDRKIRLMEDGIIFHFWVEWYPNTIFNCIDGQQDIVIQGVTSPLCRKTHVPCPKIEVWEIPFYRLWGTALVRRDNQISEAECFVLNASKKALGSVLVSTVQLEVIIQQGGIGANPAKCWADGDGRKSCKMPPISRKCLNGQKWKN